jgi:hypothetical protein
MEYQSDTPHPHSQSIQSVFDERLKVEDERSTSLTYTGLCGGLEHLKIENNGTGSQISPYC